ncbi:MAG: LacI family DNA-binding transcriptional regulator [Victivallales bacterium]|nr:LacI family DNA-binding transcriptional regulator [Victivallales bacterium]
MRITLKQLAQEAGVSVATVSFALNGSRGVSDNTRSRILRLADKHGYQPNLVARSLAGGSSRLIGVLIDSEAPQIYFKTLSYIEKEADRNGYRIMIGEAHNNVHHLHEIYEMFKQYNTSGVICLAHDYPGHEDELNRYFGECKNIVFLGRPAIENAAYVDSDRTEAFQAAINHLDSQGYCRIGMATDSLGHASILSREKIFRSIQAARGVKDIDSLLFYGNGELSDISRLFHEKIKQGLIDAVITRNDYFAGMLCKYLAAKHVRVPEDFGVIGVDNNNICMVCTPELSSIDDAREDQAVNAVKILMNMLNNRDEPLQSRQVLVKSKFIVRRSSMKDTSDCLSFSRQFPWD